MLSPFEYMILAGLTSLTSLITALIAIRVYGPRIERKITDKLSGYFPRFVEGIGKEMKKLGEKALADVDVGEIASKIGAGGAASGGGLEVLGGILGGKSGGIESLLALLGSLSGGSKQSGEGKIGL